MNAELIGICNQLHIIRNILFRKEMAGHGIFVVSPVKNIGSSNSESETKIAEKSSAELKPENSVNLSQKSKSEK